MGLEGELGFEGGGDRCGGVDWEVLHSRNV